MSASSSASQIRYRRSRLGLGSATLCLATAASLSAQAESAADSRSTSVDSVVVTGRKPGISALSETIQNTPQSINVLPKALLAQQGVRTLQEALKDVPGITLNAGEGGVHGDSIKLRGFPASVRRSHGDRPLRCNSDTTHRRAQTRGSRRRHGTCARSASACHGP